RSTFEITQFAQGIARNPDLQAVERHGKPPRIWQCRSANDELTRIGQLIADFGVSGYRSAGIICKTQKQAGKLHAALQDRGIQARLLSGSSASFTAGVIVCTAYLAKGLEFDQVIVPDVTDDHYATAMDRSQLYVACTRAMHELDLTHSGRPSRLLPGQPQPEDAGHTINQAGDDGPPTDLS
ncbi:MAG: 3'-5' exonuclease, partial [Gammaproteobacteria bacterium]